MYTAFKFRFYPNAFQVDLLNKTFGCVRFVWNQRVEHFNSWSADISQNKEKSIKEMKVDFPWLEDVPYNALEQKLQDWRETKAQYFSKTRKKKLGRPKFKKKGTRESFRLNINGFSIKNGGRDLRLIKFGIVKLRSSYDLANIVSNSILKSVTVSRNSSGQCFVSILVDTHKNPDAKPTTGKAVGIDLGLHHLATLSDGTQIENPKWFRDNQSKLAKAQKHLSRKKKGSNRYAKQRVKVARIHQKIKNQREWFLHNLSAYLINKYDHIYMEDLNVEGMKGMLGKSVSDASFSTLVNMIRYKSVWYGRSFHLVDRWFPSSKTCSSCGHKMESLPLDIREWECPSCNSHHDRDLNAAINIKRQGFIDLYDFTSEEYSDYIRGEVVRPSLEVSLHPLMAASLKRIVQNS